MNLKNYGGDEMKRTRLIILGILVVLVTSLFTSSYAVGGERLAASPYTRGGENQMKTIFMDTFYGMAAGALIATAISLTQDDPDWGANVGAGAAIGGIAGALFGIATEVKYLASLEDGHMSLGMPSLSAGADKGEQNGLIYTAGIFQYKF